MNRHFSCSLGLNNAISTSIYILFAFLLEHCASLSQVEQNDIDNDCHRPFISLSYFDINGDSSTKNKSSGESFLKSLNSSDSLHQESEIPFQYLLVTCTAPFPIEWIGDVPQQHYLFSYILNDEVRYISSSNSTGAVEDSPEITTLRIHIGNETLANNNFSGITISCQPITTVRNNYEDREDSQCKTGTTVTISTRKYNKTEFVERKNKTENSTKIVIQFGKDFPLGAKTSGHACHATEEHASNEWLICKETVNDGRVNFAYPFSSSSSECPGSIPQLKLNVSELPLPSGFLSCHGVGNDNAFNNEEFKSSHFSTLQYYYTLPNLCPGDNATLPHLYIENQKPPEEELMTFCVKYASPMHKNNVVDEGGGGELITYVGENITISCFSSILYCAHGLRILQGTGNESILDISNSSREISNGLQGYRNMTVTITVSKDKALDVLQCKAPLRKSRSWLMRTIKTRIKEPVKLSFEENHETFLRERDGSHFLLCNASGDPLPILSWSRVNHEKLPDNQSTISSSSWIASKLYFPKGGKDGKNGTEAEYIGRYICGAINQFDSIEKIFIFSGQDALGKGDGSDSTAVGNSFWITVVASVSIILTSLVILMGCKLRRQSNHFRLFSKAEIDDFIFGKPALLLNDSENYEEINSYAAYLPYDKNQFEIRREQLEFDTKDILGSGAYGTVYKGIFKDTSENETLVAIKTVNESSDKMHFAALLSEIKIMCYVGKHENIVGLVGACTKYLDQRQIYVATEFCENGDLLSYIQKHSDTFKNNAGKDESGKWTEEKGKLISDGYCKLAYASLSLLLSPHLLLVWALQISNGMLFLSSKKVIHSDLALRNVLLMADLRPKIGDFGLSKQLQKYSSYVRKGDDLLPWRWLSIEALQFLKFSIKSDVWAFGVILYELFTLGQVPYATYTYSEIFLVALCQGERLSKPFLAKEKLYELMMNCWKHSPEDRPSFQSVHNTLKILLLESESRLMSKSDHSQPQAEVIETENNESKTKLGQYVNTVDEDYEHEDELYCSNYKNDSTIKGKESEFSQTINCEKVPEFQVCKNLSDTEISVGKVEIPHFTIPSVAKGSSAYVDWNEVTS